MRAVGAIVRCLLKEFALPSFLAVGILYGSLILGSLTLPAIDAGDRAKLLETIALGGATFFSVLLAAILSALSVPRDIARHHVYPILARPIRRVEYLVGKLLGVLLLVGISLVIMGVETVLVLRGTFGLPSPQLAAHRAFIPSTRLLVRKGGGRTEIAPQRDGKVYLGTGDRLIWRFRDLPADRLPEEPEVLIQPLLVLQDSYSQPVRARVIFRKPDSRGEEAREAMLMSLRECRLEVPAPILGHQGTPDAGGPGHNEPPGADTARMESPKSLDIELIMPGDKDVIVGIQITSDRAGQEKQGLRLLVRAESFEINFFKCFFLVFLQASLVAFLGLFGSSFLSTWVSLFFGLSIYLMGSLLPVTREFSEGMIFEHAHAHHLHQHEETAPREPDVAERALRFSLGVFARYFPDFSRLDAAPLLRRRSRIPWTLLAASAGYSALYMLPLLGAAWLVFSRKDL
jgi:hypothetical protein